MKHGNGGLRSQESRSTRGPAAVGTVISTALVVCALTAVSAFAGVERNGFVELVPTRATPVNTSMSDTRFGVFRSANARMVEAPIADAAMKGDIATVRALVAKGADVNAAQGDGMTALHWAAERGDLALAQLLLKSNAKAVATTRIGAYTALHIASKKGTADIVKTLLTAGASVDVVTSSGATALHLAAASGDTSSVKALLARKADPNARESEWGQTPLMFAAAADRGDAVRVLLRAQADPSIATRMVDLSDQAKAEQAASKKRNEVMWSFLTKAEQDSLQAASAAAAKAAMAGSAAERFPRPEAAGATPKLPETPTQLLSAAEIQEAIEASREVLVAPVAEGATLAADTSDGQVAGFEGTVGMLGGMTALHHAVRQGNVDAAMALIEGGANIDQRTESDSTTPLLMAALNGQFDLAMMLVKKGANVKLASNAGATPLYAALNTQWSPRSRFPQPQSIQNQKTTHLELMEAIINAGADVNVRLTKNLWYFGYNNCGNANCGLEYLDGTTPFWRAAYAVDVDAMKLLKKHGAIDTIPSFRTATGRGRGGGGPLAAGTPATAAQGATGGAAAVGAATTRTARVLKGSGGASGGDAAVTAPGRGAGELGATFTPAPAGRGAAPAAPLDPAIDSASKAVPPGIGVYPIHAAAGVGYGNGFAGNSHRHAPDGWMPSVRYLVEELHADVNARDNNGYTPLHHAAARGDNEMILYLVSKGADVKAVSRNGRTTVDMANGPVQRLRPFPETIALLEKLGATNSHKCVSC